MKTNKIGEIKNNIFGENKIDNITVIVEENGEEEHNPSFAIGKKEKEEAVQSIESIQQEEEEDTEDIERYERTEVITVKLTMW
ncbi:hypothetical protein MKC97_17985 [[Clostridium] innocuum]|nr:hypothetical protein [[Clostridium] innocuum]